MTIRDPKPATLDRYGLSLAEWRALLDAQGGTCAVCKRAPSSGRLTTDHEHAPKWARMPAAERKRYVRGLLCYWCNRCFLARGMTIERAQAVKDYLTAYEARRPAARTARDRTGQDGIDDESR